VGTIRDRNERFIPQKDILSLRTADWIEVDYDTVEESACADALRRQISIPGKALKSDLLYYNKNRERFDYFS